jgi:hypothetical protein
MTAPEAGRVRVREILGCLMRLPPISDER